MFTCILEFSHACQKPYLMLPPPRTSARMQTEQPPPRASRRALSQRHQKHSCTRTHFAGTAPCHPTTSHTHRHTACAATSHTVFTQTHTHTTHSAVTRASCASRSKQTNKNTNKYTNARGQQPSETHRPRAAHHHSQDPPLCPNTFLSWRGSQWLN